MSAQISERARSLYRSLLRELPVRSDCKQTILSQPSPLQIHIRHSFTTPARTNGVEGRQISKEKQHFPPISALGSEASSIRTVTTTPGVQHRLAQAEQLLQYAAAQRQYLKLLERYNPGAHMGEEQRLRLTAQRVGMDLPNGE